MQLLGKNFFQDRMNSDEVEALLEERKNMQEEEAEVVTEEALLEEAGVEESIPASGGKKWLITAVDFVKRNRKHIIVAASVLVIGFAIYLNWYLYQGSLDGENPSGPAADVGGNAPEDDSIEDVGENADDYFSVAQINRQRARDEAMEVLQTVVEGAATQAEVKDKALADIASIAADIENEATIESLVKGKGFEECVAVISGENANVVVKSDTLLPNEISQIQEIVYEVAGIQPANLKIIEK